MNTLTGYVFDSDKGCFVKEYLPKYPHSEKFLVRFIYNNERYCAVIYTQIESAFSNIADVWHVTGCLLEDVRDLKFKDIKEIYSVGMDMDLLKWINEHREVTA